VREGSAADWFLERLVEAVPGFADEFARLRATRGELNLTETLTSLTWTLLDPLTLQDEMRSLDRQEVLRRFFDVLEEALPIGDAEINSAIERCVVGLLVADRDMREALESTIGPKVSYAVHSTLERQMLFVETLREQIPGAAEVIERQLALDGGEFFITSILDAMSDFIFDCYRTTSASLQTEESVTKWLELVESALGTDPTLYVALSGTFLQDVIVEEDGSDLRALAGPRTRKAASELEASA